MYAKVLKGTSGHRAFTEDERARVSLDKLKPGRKVVVRIHVRGKGIYSHFRGREYCGELISVEPTGKIKIRTLGTLHEGEEVPGMNTCLGEPLELTFQLTISGRVVSLPSRGRPQMPARTADGLRVVRRALPNKQRSRIGYVMSTIPMRELTA